MTDIDSTRERYTRTAIGLHWVIAVLILCQIVSGLWMVSAIEEPGLWERAFWVYQTHKSTGLMVLFLSLVRLGWRLGHPPPSLPAQTRAWQRVAARLGHVALYALMIAVPLAGWLVVSSSALGLPTFVFGWLPWPHLPLSPTFEPTAKLAHRTLAFALCWLAAGHVAAALMHHVAVRDGLLRRMLPRR